MQPPLIVGLALSLAYLLGDFPLQSSGLTNVKQRGWTRFVGRGLVHWVLVLLMLVIFAHEYVSLSWRLVIAVALYATFHLILEIGKVHLIEHRHVADSTKMFVVDQGLHGALVLGLTVFVANLDWQALWSLCTVFESAKNLILAGAVVYVSVIFAGGYLIRYMTAGLVRSEEIEQEESIKQLENAGLYIGWLERFLIVTAVILRSPTLIGLILTGKSIARFPEMKEPKFAEYFLIGTLLSFTLALLGGLLLLRIWKGTVSLQP